MTFVRPETVPRTGNAAIDLWHRRLAQTINHAYDVWHETPGTEDVAVAMDEFFAEVRRHFAKEESILRGAGYDDWQRHVVMHRAIREKLQALRDGLRSDSAVQGELIDAFAYIDNLIYDHEFIEDQDFWRLFAKGHQPVEGAPLVTWLDRFDLGVAELDAQHRALVDDLNALHDLVRSGKSGQVVCDALKALRDHSANHFLAEEAWLTEHGLPDFGEHKDLHEYLLDDFDDLIADSAGFAPEGLKAMAENYLRFWLIDHIVNADAAIRKWAKGQRR